MKDYANRNTKPVKTRKKSGRKRVLIVLALLIPVMMFWIGFHPSHKTPTKKQLIVGEKAEKVETTPSEPKKTEYDFYTVLQKNSP